MDCDPWPNDIPSGSRLGSMLDLLGRWMNQPQFIIERVSLAEKWGFTSGRGHFLLDGFFFGPGQHETIGIPHKSTTCGIVSS